MIRRPAAGIKSKHWQEGQSIVEYLVIAGLMIGAFIAMSGVVKDKAQSMSESVVSDMPNFPIPDEE